MNYTTELKNKTKENLEKITKYIEENILPYIDYDYETPEFGPIEKWGVYDENHGARLTIRVNGSSNKIEFRHAGIPFDLDNVVNNSYFTKYGVWLCEYWFDAKAYLNTEIQTNNDTIKLINEFEI